ncbi:VOC family protein [Lysinibacter cavernae]|uniref:VOC domain-containing protein n=2 Tax=Lysinibacter cavernae TaxID=1640652 RepID=A0A7X5R467_9MICO|nr:VOC family protein [Lysinibacter cavernae]NIH55354.1 hypothetical protein [Lysinibacter cavernae]
MSAQIFINLPVSDLDASKAFYTSLGFTINEQFTDENASCVVISDTIYVMLLVPKYFAQFSEKEPVNAATHGEVINALGLSSEADVDAALANAASSGANVTKLPTKDDFMYQGAFRDLDGHSWEVFYMDPAQVQG